MVGDLRFGRNRTVGHLPAAASGSLLVAVVEHSQWRGRRSEAFETRVDGRGSPAAGCKLVKTIGDEGEDYAHVNPAVLLLGGRRRTFLCAGCCFHCLRCCSGGAWAVPTSYWGVDGWREAQQWPVSLSRGRYSVEGSMYVEAEAAGRAPRDKQSRGGPRHLTPKPRRLTAKLQLPSPSSPHHLPQPASLNKQHLVLLTHTCPAALILFDLDTRIYLGQCSQFASGAHVSPLVGPMSAHRPDSLWYSLEAFVRGQNTHCELHV